MPATNPDIIKIAQVNVRIPETSLGTLGVIIIPKLLFLDSINAYEPGGTLLKYALPAFELLVGLLMAYF